MKFLFSIMTLASIAGALMSLYVGAGSVLKLNESSDQDKALAAERAAAVVTRIAQRNGTLAKWQANSAPSFGPLNFSFWSPDVTSDEPASDRPESATASRTTTGFGGHEPTSYTAAGPKLSIIPPSLWELATSRRFSAPVAPFPRIVPRRTPTPAEEARAVYLKYATLQ